VAGWRSGAQHSGARYVPIYWWRLRQKQRIVSNVLRPLYAQYTKNPFEEMA